MSDDLLYDVNGVIGVITLNRPHVRNALTFEMYEGIAKICREQTENGTARALIIQGAGDKAFAAGTDMTQFRVFSTPQDALLYEERMDHVLRDIEQCNIPTIAALTGACTGGGAGIAAACDLRICDQALKFGFPIARTLGNCLSISNLSRLASLIGPGLLREIIFTARLIKADEAHRIGLVSEVSDNAEMVRGRALELAQQVASHAPLTLKATKEGLRRLRVMGSDAKDEDIVVKTYMSEDFKEGMDAFLSKRKPKWTGK